MRPVQLLALGLGAVVIVAAVLVVRSRLEQPAADGVLAGPVPSEVTPESKTTTLEQAPDPTPPADVLAGTETLAANDASTDPLLTDIPDGEPVAAIPTEAELSAMSRGDLLVAVEELSAQVLVEGNELLDQRFADGLFEYLYEGEDGRLTIPSDSGVYAGTRIESGVTRFARLPRVEYPDFYELHDRSAFASELASSPVAKAK